MMLKLNKEIFDTSSITAAVTAYKELASIAVDDTPDYWACIFSECKCSEIQTVSEFENYLIDLMNCKTQ